jgi:hypothetical protein
LRDRRRPLDRTAPARATGTCPRRIAQLSAGLELSHATHRQLAVRIARGGLGRADFVRSWMPTRPWRAARRTRPWPAMSIFWSPMSATTLGPAECCWLHACWHSRRGYLVIHCHRDQRSTLLQDGSRCALRCFEFVPLTLVGTGTLSPHDWCCAVAGLGCKIAALVGGDAMARCAIQRGRTALHCSETVCGTGDAFYAWHAWSAPCISCCGRQKMRERA